MHTHILFAEHAPPNPKLQYDCEWHHGLRATTGRASVTGGCRAAVCGRSQWAAPCLSQLLTVNSEMDVNSPWCSRNLNLSEPVRRSMSEHVAPLLKQIWERAAPIKGRRYVRRHMEEDIDGDMAGDAPLEGEAPHQSRDMPEGLWLMENPYQSRGTPERL